MNTGQQGGKSRLDHILDERGPDACRAALRDTYNESWREVDAMLSEDALSYRCFYILIPEIDALSLASFLSPRQAAALSITGSLRGTGNHGVTGNYLTRRHAAAHDALLWMVATSERDADTDADYLHATEIAACMLLGTYGDMLALPEVCNLMFSRHAEGRNTHYVEWAFYCTGANEALTLTCERLRSDNAHDRDYACALLGAAEEGGDTRNAYENYTNFLSENRGYLTMPDDSRQYRSAPEVCTLDLERKYLHRAKSTLAPEPIIPENDDERGLLSAFTSLPEREKLALSRHSSLLYANDPRLWELWLHSPIEKQLADAKEGKGDAQ